MSIQDAGVLACNGNADTRKHTGGDYSAITWDEVLAMVLEPAAKANGATDEEIREAVAMAAISRHWSTVLNGMQVDLNAFKSDTDAVLKLAGEKAKATN